MSKEITIGKIYETRDGRKVACFKQDTVFCRFNCVVIGSGEFFDVNSEGFFYDSRESHNDLVKEL